MKKFISGLIIGLAISGSVAFASENYSIVQNAFPIYVDGKQENVEALNINGTTWIRLGSIAGILGADVKFDEVSKQINITGGDRQLTNEEIKAADEAYAKAEEEAAQRSVERKAAELGKSIPKYYTENGLDMMMYNDKKYIKPNSISRNRDNCAFGYDLDTHALYVYDSKESFHKNEEPILTTTYLDIDEIAWIEYTYYTDTILPLIQ